MVDSLEMAILAWETKCVGKMPLVYSFSKKEMAKRKESHMASSYMVNDFCFLTQQLVEASIYIMQL